jgi:hypothetical protein
MLTHAAALVIIITTSQEGAPPSRSESSGRATLAPARVADGDGDMPQHGIVLRMFSARGMMLSNKSTESGGSASASLRPGGGRLSG